MEDDRSERMPDRKMTRREKMPAGRRQEGEDAKQEDN
jgi:hypothetical protein